MSARGGEEGRERGEFVGGGEGEGGEVFLGREEAGGGGGGGGCHFGEDLYKGKKDLRCDFICVGFGEGFWDVKRKSSARAWEFMIGAR